ncbi:uncharacterized protein BP01DRAFT_373324 [Aspergillus saccharolyticus JOP 1030-1]|uniref:Aminoglycoside phosphotransferase domain-containing protein n=1 Tax=Aspergillus saccharolyticus JOP 1030-1 TaxID=1450539 RepID=A0A318ZHE3_9EURO|nr:hypothetical protein BP01DRAFT_373324 [Aspergillus saccharolyticus JOP 1030-1]PYH46365.1 hypothetical protein BP01DRAFT_373324 [Aspergillus saccharolyticus JOP 1030-1]
MKLDKKHRPGETVRACQWGIGTCNIYYRGEKHDKTNVIVHSAALGKAILRKEKVQIEVATMRYIRENASIPVSDVFGTGICWAGRYIVMSCLEGVPRSTLLKDSSSAEKPVLSPQLSERSLKPAYCEMAAFIIEWLRHGFDSIGALREDGGNFSITRRSLTSNMSELMVSANLPEGSACYLHISHLQLRLQQRDAASSEDDYRKKFIAHLFLEITKDICAEDSQGPVRLYCDGFGPSNVLIDTAAFRVSGEGDLVMFLSRYHPELRVFVEALGNHESELIERQILSESQRLSPRMEDSVKTGLFWVCLAVRYSSMLDEIYCKFIDNWYYGPFNSLYGRMQLWDPKQQQDMIELGRLKTGQADDKDIFVNHYPITELLELRLCNTEHRVVL